MSRYSLASTLRAVAGRIDSAKVSNTKWNPVRDLLSEALNEDPDDVYVTTVSKPGNLSVRLEQSTRGRNAPVVAAMYTGNRAELPQCVESAVRRCAGRRTILVFERGSAGVWTLAALVKPSGVPVPPVLSTEYPAASVVNG